MTENVRKVFDILGVEPYEKFMIENSIYTYEITKNLFVICSDGVSFIRDKDNNDNFLTNLLNGTYKIIKLSNKKHVGDLICKELECKNCPLYSINCDAGDTYSNLYKNLEFHYEQFKDKEIYDLFKKRLDKEIEEKMLKTRNEEIEYIHTNRVDFGENNLLRDDLVIREVVIAATDTYINLSLFYNDYEILYFKKLINEKVYINALNDLYLLALLHIDDEEYERIREELEDNA